MAGDFRRRAALLGARLTVRYGWRLYSSSPVARAAHALVLALFAALAFMPAGVAIPGSHCRSHTSANHRMMPGSEHLSHRMAPHGASAVSGEQPNGHTCPHCPPATCSTEPRCSNNVSPATIATVTSAVPPPIAVERQIASAAAFVSLPTAPPTPPPQLA
jgi:hypothetical protein